MAESSVKDIKVQDAIENSWVDNLAPTRLRPYLRLSRLDRPVGAWLLFLPCVFATLLSAASSQASWVYIFHVLLVCMAGSWLMRGAGCTWNDIVDRKIDAKVERTKTRPIPSGQVTVRQAIAWMIIQMIFAAIGLLTFRTDVIFLTLASIVIVAIYPFAKRFTYWPQLVLGLCFNWGALVAWSQISGGLSLSAYALNIAMIFWTLFYDRIYAFQDIDDDALIGVKSSAIALGKNAKLGLVIMLFGVCFFGTLSIFLNTNSDPKWFYLFFLGFISVLANYIRKFNALNAARCLQIFRGNVFVGKILAATWILVLIWQ